MSEVHPIGPIKCNSYSNGWITTTTGPCTDFRPPENVMLGEVFSERGINHTIKVIVASQVEKDYDDGKWSIKKGEWYCVAAETSEDLEQGSKDRKTWLFIPKCVPIR